MDRTATKNEQYTVLTDDNFKSETTENPMPILIEIGANWSGSCHIMAPIIEAVVRGRAGMRFGRLDIDTNERIAREFGVTDMPILLFFRNGRLMDHVIGPVSKKFLQAKVQELLQE